MRLKHPTTALNGFRSRLQQSGYCLGKQAAVSRIQFVIAFSALVFAGAVYPRVIVADESVRTNRGASIAESERAHSTSDADAYVIRRPSENGKRAGGSDAGGEQTDGMLNLGAGDVSSMAWPLFVVLGLIFVSAVAFRRMMPRSMRASGGAAINIVARQYLSSKQSLCLVQVGRRVVLVGMTGERMTALSEITDSEEIGELTAKVARTAPSSFSSTLTALSGGENDDEPEVGALRRRRQPAAAHAVAVGNDDRIESTTDQRVRDLVKRIRSLSVGSGGA